MLEKIQYPKDLRNIERSDLNLVCKELREFIIDSIADNPGHLGASLGVVELTVALHYVYNTPYDQLIWDVGHQAYGHKILTGRKDQFHTNRKLGGLSGFPRMNESEYDAFGVGHSSTSISAALGMAVAAENQKRKDQHFVAVIGDGALTGGMAFEAMNHAGFLGSNILVILNDNNMAIDPNVGALHNMITAETNLFKAYQFEYHGPIDGHNVQELVDYLSELKEIEGPKILHIKTVKGKGFKKAETSQTEWHYSPGKFNKTTGELLEGKSDDLPPKFQDVFGITLLELAKKNDKIVGITPAMPTGSSLNRMIDEMPDRVFDVGIAEQHAVTFSAGLATQGLIPYCNIYSTFMQRGYDQVIHDVALQKLAVVFCLDRAGLVGADGPTHHGVFDLAFFRSVPNMVIASPLDENELQQMLYSASIHRDLPYVIRYPRGRGRNANWHSDWKEIPKAKGRKMNDGKGAAILSLGPIGLEAKDAIQSRIEKGVDYPAWYDMRFLKPLDEDLLHEVLSNFSEIITIEDGVRQGGFGSAVLEFAMDHGYKPNIQRLAVPDEFIEHGTPQELYALCNIDANAVNEAIEKAYNRLGD